MTSRARIDVLSVLGCVALVMLGWGGYRGVVANLEMQQAREFEIAVDVRIAQLREALLARAGSLDSLSAFFEASEHVDAAEFGTFATALRDQYRLDAVCWQDTTTTEEWSVPSRADACESFQVLERAKLTSRDPVQFVLSQFVQSRGGQGGHVIIGLSLNMQRFADPTSGLTDELIVHDRLQNTAQTVALSPGTAAPGAATIRHIEVARFQDIGFVYLAHDERRREAQTLVGVIALLASALGLLALGFLRSMLFRRIEIEAEVVRRTDELSQFAYRTSHDLQSPLVTVGGLARVAMEDLSVGDTQEVKDNLQRIEGEVSRLSTLVRDILTLTRADLGAVAGESVDIAQIVEDVVAAVAVQAASTGVDLRTKVDVDVRPVLPRARLMQILENLVSNGAKYASPDRDTSFVTVHVRHVRQRLEIAVADNGLGIDSDDQPRVFEMFTRFHAAASRQGSGLGMAIVKRHVDAMDGTIRIDSAPDVGTTVRVSLPIRSTSV